MKKGWITNLILIAVIAGISAFLHLKPKDEQAEIKDAEVSQMKMAGFKQVAVEFPTKAPVVFEKIDGAWQMTAPFKTRADQQTVQRILSIIAAKTKTKLSAQDLAKYGLDNPKMRLILTNETGDHAFSFGTYNPVTEEQYIGFEDSAYLLPVSYAEAAEVPPIEMIDKSPLSLAERKQIVGFDFSHLEQFEGTNLNLDMNAGGKWQVNIKEANIKSDEINEWVTFQWAQARATSVERYTPSQSDVQFPIFSIKLKDGKTVVFAKMQESPDYLIARPDEGIIYHFPNDVGFTMVNPPLNIQ